MNVDSRKNKQLIKQFPFIENILRQEMEPHRLRDGESITFVDDLTIVVQRADGDLMFRQADNIGLGDHSLLFAIEGQDKGKVGRKGEYLYAVGKGNEILTRVNWPKNQQMAAGTYPVYGHNALWATRNGSHMSNPMADKVTHLVWVTIWTWHKDTGTDGEPESRFGECLERRMRITVYRPPNDGFRKLEEESSVWSNLRLNKDVTLRAILDKDSEITQMIGCTWELCKMFQEEVWDKGMKQAYELFYEKSKIRGASGQFGPTEVLVADMCGYHRVMFQNSSCWITFQLRPSGTDMYVLGQDGTLPQLRQLVRPMIFMWREHPECHANFKANEKVKVM